MPDKPQTPTAVEPKRNEKGQLVAGGGSLNPGGEPRWLREVRSELEAGSLDAAKYLARVVRGEEKFLSVVGKDATQVELPVMPKDRIAASKVVFEYIIPKPREVAADADKGKKALPDLPKALIDELARLDS